MGPYRDFVDSLVRFGNVWSQATSTPGAIKTSAFISGTELQVLEYILENEDLHQKMAEVAQRLYIPQSSFSKIVKQLVEKGLLEKYHAKGNQKDVIVQVSEKGRKVYLEYAEGAKNGKWGEMFKTLDKLPQEAVSMMTDMFNEFSSSVIYNNLNDEDGSVTPEDELVRIE